LRDRHLAQQQLEWQQQKLQETQFNREELAPANPAQTQWHYLIPCPCATAKSRTAATGDAIAL